MTAPTDRALQAITKIDHAHARLRQAWQHHPDGHLQTGRPDTGRITTSHIPDPASDTAAVLEHARTRVMADVAEATAEVATIDTIAADPAPVWRARRLADILALHRQWSAQLLTRIRALQADPAGWDDAQHLTGTLEGVAHTIHRISLHAFRILTQPDAPPGLTVCDNDACQRPTTELLCHVHKARAERAAYRLEQRRRQVAADRANGIRCWGTAWRDCETLLSDTDRDRGRRNCGACRTAISRRNSQTVGTGGTFTWADPE